MKKQYLVIIFIVLSTLDIYGEGFNSKVITDSLRYPWGFEFIDSSHVIVTEKPGQIKLVDIFTGHKINIPGGPEVVVIGQGGLLDVIKHPMFAHNKLLFFSYSKQIGLQATTAVARGKLAGNIITDIKDILVTNAVSGRGHHFGSRLAFDKAGFLYITVGDRGDRRNAQDLKSHGGKTLRLSSDGSVPADNPFINNPKALQEIYTFGHRNPQGIAYDFEHDIMWLNEHGPKGGDEVNILKKGANYGWPIITYGREYSGLKVTDKTHQEGMEQPIWQWTPSIAPSGMAVITRNLSFARKGDLIVGALKFKLLSVLTTHDKTIGSEKRVMEHYGERIRSVKMGPDGFIYLLTDSDNGKLIRVSFE